MKKAKEYANEWLLNPTDRALANIMVSFIREMGEIIESRRCKTTHALIAVTNEQNTKWKAFARRCEDQGVREDGFARYIRKDAPEIFWAWQEISKTMLILE